MLGGGGGVSLGEDFKRHSSQLGVGLYSCCMEKPEKLLAISNPK